VSAGDTIWLAQGVTLLLLFAMICAFPAGRKDRRP
jgi:hypothetical protein